MFRTFRDNRRVCYCLRTKEPTRNKRHRRTGIQLGALAHRLVNRRRRIGIAGAQLRLDGHESKLLRPDNTRRVGGGDERREPNDAYDGRFVGVVGFYRALERANWRTVVAIQPNQTQQLAINVGDLAISATVALKP